MNKEAESFLKEAKVWEELMEIGPDQYIEPTEEKKEEDELLAVMTEEQKALYTLKEKYVCSLRRLTDRINNMEAEGAPPEKIESFQTDNHYEEMVAKLSAITTVLCGDIMLQDKRMAMGNRGIAFRKNFEIVLVKMPTRLFIIYAERPEGTIVMPLFLSDKKEAGSKWPTLFIRKGLGDEVEAEAEKAIEGAIGNSKEEQMPVLIKFGAKFYVYMGVVNN